MNSFEKRLEKILNEAFRRYNIKINGRSHSQDRIVHTGTEWAGDPQMLADSLASKYADRWNEIVDVEVEEFRGERSAKATAAPAGTKM